MEVSKLIDHNKYMSLALEQARLAGERGEVPVGAVLVRGDTVIASCGNTTQADGEPICHAEINAMRAGCLLLGDWRLSDCTLYVTLEPCSMCAGTMINAHLGKVVYGASDPIAGVLGSRIHLFDLNLGYRPHVCAGVMAEECGALLSDFFLKKR